MSNFYIVLVNLIEQNEPKTCLLWQFMKKRDFSLESLSLAMLDG